MNSLKESLFRASLASKINKYNIVMQGRIISARINRTYGALTEYTKGAKYPVYI